MKVRMMIELLGKYNPEAEVQMHAYGGKPVLFVVARENDASKVWLECENDLDLANELNDRWETAMNENWDETDFCMDLLDMGITVEIVREYVGDRQADWMQRHCEDHGLL